MDHVLLIAPRLCSSAAFQRYARNYTQVGAFRVDEQHACLPDNIFSVLDTSPYRMDEPHLC
jgi:hypothetical protein